MADPKSTNSAIPGDGNGRNVEASVHRLDRSLSIGNERPASAEGKAPNPENRKPEDDEVATCSPYLYRQLDVIAPKAIVCLGGTAAQALLKTKDSISRFRGTWFDYRNT